MRKEVCLIGYILWMSHLIGMESRMLSYPFPSSETEMVAGYFDSVQAQRKVNQSIVEKSKTLEQKIRQKIFGQDAAVQETANAIVRYAAGVNDPFSPIASLLFCGPSGVGKTELARQLCLELYGDEDCLIRLNMSEYSEAHTVSRLIGSPPGYIGYESGGGLTNRLSKTPHAVVLLDEIEKAHPNVLKLFLHVFDAGHLTAASGLEVNCCDAIFILTSNLAAPEIAELFGKGLNHQQILTLLQPHFMQVLSPEMYNRLDCMIFAPLSEEVFEKLIRKILGELKERVCVSKGVGMCFDASLISYLKTFSIDPKLGARPLKRIVEKELTTVIARAIIECDCKEGDTIICAYKDGQIELEVVFSEE